MVVYHQYDCGNSYHAALIILHIGSTFVVKRSHHKIQSTWPPRINNLQPSLQPSTSFSFVSLYNNPRFCFATFQVTTSSSFTGHHFERFSSVAFQATRLKSVARYHRNTRFMVNGPQETRFCSANGHQDTRSHSQPPKYKVLLYF